MNIDLSATIAALIDKGVTALISVLLVCFLIFGVHKIVERIVAIAADIRTDLKTELGAMNKNLEELNREVKAQNIILRQGGSEKG